MSKHLVKIPGVAVMLACLAAQSAPCGEPAVLAFSRHPLGLYFKPLNEIEQKLTFSCGRHVCPKISPGGDRLLFTSTRNGKHELWTVNVDGKEESRVCEGEQGRWSPDGGRILFVRDGRIVERVLAANEERVLTPGGPGSCSFPEYMPGGGVIFCRSEGLRNSAFLLKPGGRPELLLGLPIAGPVKPSPDGQMLAFSDGVRICIFDLKERTTRRLTLGGGIQSWPAWSSNGKCLAYCQGPQFGNKQDVLIIEIAHPERPMSLVSEIDSGFDFRQGDRLPIDRNGDERPLKGLSLRAPDANQSAGDAVFGNDWYDLEVSAGGGKMSCRPRAAEGEASGFRVILPGGKDFPPVQKHGHDRIALDVAAAGAKGKRGDASLTLERTSPLIRFDCADREACVEIEAQIGLAVIPDRCASDVLLQPALCDKGNLRLPSMPLLLCLPRAGEGALLVVTPDAGQRIALRGDGDSFVGLTVHAQGRPFYAGTIAEKGFGAQADLELDAASGASKVRWKEAFYGQWRMCLSDGAMKHFAFMLDEEDLMRNKASHVLVKRAFDGPSPRCVVYLQDRSRMTPSNVLSLSDVLRQALGISEYNRLTDVEGLRAYRTAQRPVPVPEVGPIAKYLGTFSAKHASAAHSHMVADLVALLRGLDDRAAEYERFLQKTEDLCAAATPGARGFASEIVTRVQDLRRRCPAIEVSDLGQLEKTISARPDAANAAAAQRQRLLSAYREFARQLRTEATLKIIKSPEAAEFCERLRALTREVLRNRYYLEGDWLGERPIGALR